MNEDLTLVPEVRARLALGTQRLSLRVLVPLGSWIGCGALRVLRMRCNEDRSAEMVAGYDSYEPVASP